MNTAVLLLTLTTSCHQASREPPLADTKALVRDLGGDYRERTAATRVLSAMGEDARPALTQALQHEDAEARRRAGMLLHWLSEARRKKAMAMVDAAFPSCPWIDLAYIAPHDPQACQALSKYLDAAYDAEEPREGCPAAWGRFRAACRLMLYDMAEAGVPLVVLRATVAELAQREERWLDEYRKR